MRIVPLTPAYAADVVTWRYPAPYQRYDMTGVARFAPEAFRVTVASFNVRALRVVTSLGFRAIGQFHALAGGTSFEMLARPEPAAART
ncbi:MAG TPA: hypothetical protein VN840_03395 [Streptosporangiaceae bacterium]|nr:hypothetical protein [Streptosporangiaceae bacterium]